MTKILIPILFLLSSETTLASYKNYKRPESIISAQGLKKLIESKKSSLVIIAVAKPLLQYGTGHIPGAIQTWRPDYENKGALYGGMLATPTDFQKFARKLGINNDSTVVIYDHKYDSTRLWWAFYTYGKKDIKILDGGIQSWKKEGYPLEVLPSFANNTGNFTSKRTNIMVANMDKLTIKNDKVQIFDTRDFNEWNGRILKKGAY